MSANYEQQNVVNDPPDLNTATLLRDILDELRVQNAPTEPADPPGWFQLVPGTNFAAHVRLRAKQIILSLSAADTVLVQDGTRTYPFYCGAGTTSLPFERQFQEGHDLMVTAVTSNNNIVNAILVAEPIGHKTK